MKTSDIIKPFVKWVGGKGQLVPKILPLVPETATTYLEPFIGGGAVYFALANEIAQGKRKPFDEVVISDLNHELVTTYKTVRDNVEELITVLNTYKYDKDLFLEIRSLNPEELSPVKCAARFIFLNRTCFNGMYRVNAKGKFNSPFGKYNNPTICNEVLLRNDSKALQGVEILCADFETTLAATEIKENTFIYLDPPYAPVSLTSNFVSFTKEGFGAFDQVRLRDIVVDCKHKGATIVASNADTTGIRELYKDFDIEVVHAKRLINCKSTKRGYVNEVLIR